MRLFLLRVLRRLYRIFNTLIGDFLPAPARQFLQKVATKIRHLKILRPRRTTNWMLHGTLPDWALQEMRKIAMEIDPDLYPTQALLDNMGEHKVMPYDLPGQTYARLVAPLKSSYTHCFVIPWLVRGGADKGVLMHVQAIAEIPENKILVIQAEQRDSHWRDRLPMGVDYVDLGNASSTLNEIEKLKILSRILVQICHGVIHVIGSPLGMVVFEKHGISLRQQGYLFLSLYSQGYTQEGVPISHAQTFLPSCYKNINHVISDSHYFPELLMQQKGYDAGLFKTAYFPTEIPATPIAHSPKVMGKILWASRMDREKRLDILAQIAESLPEYQFLVYGTALFSVDKVAMRKLKSLKNVELHGAYDGFESLPVTECDLYLYTSQYDGMPNVLLEAAAHGLPIVASNVGGISELINADTGALITPYDDVDGYVNAIKAIMADKPSAIARAGRALEIIKTRHSFDAFKKTLAAIPEYLHPTPKGLEWRVRPLTDEDKARLEQSLKQQKK